MKKVVRTSLNNVANKRGVRDLNIQLYSHDKNNAGFEFVIKNEVDLSEYKAKVLFDFQESFATWETKGIVEGNIVKVKFDTTFITKCEEVIGYLFLDSETDTLDVFKFKFNVVLSEIDKYDMAKRGFRYIKDQEVVDVITRSELQEELAKLQVNAGVDLSNYLTTSVASETYAKKTDLPAPYNDSALVERVTNLENKTPVDLSNYALKTEIPQPYNDSELVQKIGQLEARVDKDTVYDDTPLKQRVEALETKVDKDTVYDDTNIKERLTNLENKPSVDASNFVTNEALEEKHYVTNEQISSTYATKSEIPQPYSDTELVNRVSALETKVDKDTVYDDTKVKERLTALENRPTTGGIVDTSNFVAKNELNTLKPNQTLSLNNSILSISGGNSVELPVNKYEIHGTGMPNGVVEAEIGTTYVDKNKTNGALKWIKTTNGGNTGWEVLIGDTGWRTLNSISKLTDGSRTSTIKIRRVNNLVTYQFGGLQWGWFGIIRRNGPGFARHNSSGDRGAKVLGVGGIPSGFRSETSLVGSTYDDKGRPYGIWYLGGVTDSNFIQFTFNDPIPTDRDIGDIRVSAISYLTNEQWPLQLP